jgi:tetratricopeptide (TPR) repeat protein
MDKSNLGTATQRFRRARHFAVATLSAALLAGCASTMTVGSDGQPSIEPLMNQADSELGKGRRDQAIALLNQAAKESPTNVAPWLKIANIWFDESNYASSILAANEALARDGNNQEAKSLLVVSGLRVAAKAVQGLVPHNPVNTNARQEAENLTKSLRQALGEKVLVPVESDKSASPAPRQRSRKIAVRGSDTVRAETATAASSGTVATTAAPAQAGTVRKVSVTVDPKVSVNADPFKSLK